MIWSSEEEEGDRGSSWTGRGRAMERSEEREGGSDTEEEGEEENAWEVNA
jgi:hypothetical protein